MAFSFNNEVGTLNDELMAQLVASSQFILTSSFSVPTSYFPDVRWSYE
jgi:hypothetical protein